MPPDMLNEAGLRNIVGIIAFLAPAMRQAESPGVIRKILLQETQDLCLMLLRSTCGALSSINRISLELEMHGHRP
ncbi:MAG: hypothetical protein JXR32_04585 [Anaerolineaceae bacterium]|nr:hypothetical protein [Anaerolineaceae bacterium]